MLDIKYVRANLDRVKESLAQRGADVDMTRYEALDARRRELLAEVEELKSQRNTASRRVAEAKRAGEDAQELIDSLGAMGERIKLLDEELKTVDAQVWELLMQIPNLPDTSVPVGACEADNPVVRVWGEKPEYDFTPLNHWDLVEKLGGVDFERAAKLSGARFVVLRGWAAALERALATFMLDVHTTEHGYTEVLPPTIVTRQTMTGTGQLPKFEHDLFKLQDTDSFLIPTAEVPVTNLHADETLDEESLPLGYCAFTPCFRSEAGSHGKDTRGLIRLHEFRKVELVHFATPEDSFNVLERLTANAEKILQKLGLHYRVIELCTGDMGFSAAKTYDLEVWLPGQQAYREISSCSNCTDFQARRAQIRCKTKSAKKSRLAHTLNGSGLAVGRTMVAVLENYQQADGSVVIPEVLRPYMKGLAKIETLD